MQASIVDLRYKMKDVLKALERNERVEVLYHGKVKGILTSSQKNHKRSSKDHPLFGMQSSNSSVEETMESLRASRNVI